MKTAFIYLFILFFLAFTPTASLYSQCLTAPTATCTNTEPLATDGEILNAGTTKWYYGPAASFNLLKLNGGTLIVGGNLTIDKFYMDSGKIFIQPGARLVIGGGIGSGLVLRGHSYLYNYGILEIQRNLSLENGWTTAAKPNVLINAASSAVLKMANQYFVINNANSWFINKGRADFHGLITDPQAAAHSVCLGKGSETVMTVLYNKVKNSYFAPEPYACVSVSEFSQLWDTLTTTSPYIHVCLGPTHRLDTSCKPWGCKPSWGLADIFAGCTSCSSIKVLSNNFIFFSVTSYLNGNTLLWEMEKYSSTGLFYIERAVDGHQFKTIDSFTSLGYTTKYAYSDEAAFTGTGYYRIKYVDTISQFTIYSPITKLVKKQTAGLLIYPNPFTDKLWLSLAKPCPPAILVIENVYGEKIREQLLATGSKWQINFPQHVPPGIYLITLTSGDNVWKQKMVKQ